MICAYCNGAVTWRGPMSALTHTQCTSCGRTNCQQVDETDDDASIDEANHLDQLSIEARNA